MNPKLPDDVHGHVLDLAADLVNASAQGDTKATWSLYAELKEFCEATSGSGRDHPFLWEALADFTPDDNIAIDFYLRALVLADGLETRDYSASIRFELARRCMELGFIDRACDYALEADCMARGLDDLDLRRDISQFLLDHLPGAA